MFPIRIIKPMGQPVKRLINWEIPLTPPEVKFAGIKNKRNERAWIKAARTIKK
jgi:hypothetical protein